MRWIVGDGERTSGCVGASLGTGRCAGPRTDESRYMISVRTWLSETMMQVDHSFLCLGTYFKNTESRQNCGQKIRALREMCETFENFFGGLNICDCNETSYLDQTIEVLRDIERHTVLVTGGTAQVKDVFEQVKVVVA